jgi:alpha-L-fucosidase
MKKGLTIFLIILLFSIIVPGDIIIAQYTIPAKMAWWYEARFGMFIHFGSYSYLGHGEWAFFTENWNKLDYQTQVSANFNPSDFNGGTIAELAKNAGMKYIVITAKHHEGFCMWDTEVESFTDVTGTSDYDLPGFTEFDTRDILQELKDSCEVRDIKFCLYYSILDWCHSSQEVNHDNYYSTMASDSVRTAYITDMKAQLSELISKYHPAVMWFDGDWTYNDGLPTPDSWWIMSDGIDLYDYILDLDSTIIINERVCRGFDLGDFECPENTVPDEPPGRQWETCRTMNNSWGYKVDDTNYKTPAYLIQEMVMTVSRDGNYLLNIGPRGDGTVPDQSVTILNSFGDWMNIYGESIYGTTRSPYNTEPYWGFYTKKTGRLYMHVFSWPADGLVRIPSLTNSINKIYGLNDTTTVLSYTDSLGCLTISGSVNAPDSINSVVVIDVEGVPAPSTQYIKVSEITVQTESGLNSITSYGDSLQMVAVVTPSNAAIQTVTWSVSDTARASISSDGMLTAKNNGPLYVYAASNDGTGIRNRLVVRISGQTGIDDHLKPSLPVPTVLEQNYPNPFNPLTTIHYKLSQPVEVTINIFDILGKHICTLVNQLQQAGNHSVTWDGTDKQGRPVSGGIYFYQLRSNGLIKTQKMVLQR